VAQTLLIVSGGLDISVGSVVSFSGVLMVDLTTHVWNIWLAVAAMLVAGALIGALNGFLVIRMGVNPLITTLGTMSIFAGLAALINALGLVLEVNDSVFNFLGSGTIAQVPMPFILFLAITIVAFVVERFTGIGRSVFAIGGNREAARLVGIRVDMVPFVLYVLSGLSAAVAGLLLTSQLSASSSDIGASYTLSVVTAVILGGASLAGGRGSVIGTLLAVLLLGVLQNGFTLLQASSNAQTMILGIALILAVLIDQSARRLRASAVTGNTTTTPAATPSAG
jgi:ribose transport system permease protein